MENGVRELREKKNLSVYDLTGDDMQSKSHQHWQAIGNGKKNVNIPTAFKIARSLEIGLDELLKDVS